MPSRSAALFQFNDRRPSIIHEVVDRIVRGTSDPLSVLNDAAYWETKRLSDHEGSELSEWRSLASSLGRLSQTELRSRLYRIALRYAEDIAGSFEPKVYSAISRIAVPVIGTLLRPRRALSQLTHIGDLSALDDRVLVQGPTAHIRRLAEHGTVVFVPTHLSNLDSVVFGFALERSGLPPATYGAGKNLFTNPVLSFFMQNLGAYKVDRRLKHALYKDVLKTYSAVLIEQGYHSLFFPGGTRSRSGGVERKLKLGLAGTGLEAFIRNRERNVDRKVFFVPATINYLLTLEAETLIDDFLKDEGKARYIIDDDESTRFGRVASFMQKLVGLDASVIIRFSRPIDCFGNFVDDLGQSYDARGHLVDAYSFIYDEKDQPIHSRARDAEYTRELGASISAAYLRDTVLMSTHLVAAVAFQSLAETVGQADLFALLRPRDHVNINRAVFLERLETLLTRVRDVALQGEVAIAPNLAGRSAQEVLDEAVRAFSGYHTQEVLVLRGEDVVLVNTRLVFYYQNRLAAHGLTLDFIAPRK